MKITAKIILSFISACLAMSVLAAPTHCYFVYDICGEQVFAPQWVSDEVKYYDVPIEDELQDYIRSTVEKLEIDIPNGFELVLAMAHTESRFHFDSENGRCKGVMQVSEIHQETLDELGVEDLFNPYDCFKAGIYFLKCGFDNADLLWLEIDDCSLSEEEFRLNCALMSYNLGAYGAREEVRSGVYSTSYVDKVRKAMAELEPRVASERQ